MPFVTEQSNFWSNKIIISSTNAGFVMFPKKQKNIFRKANAKGQPIGHNP